MAENDLRVIVKAEELVEHSLRVSSNCNRYPKKFRHTLVDRIQNKSLDIYDNLLEANRTNNVHRKQERCELITKVITDCDRLSFYIKLSKNLGLLSDGSMEHWQKMISDVKYMSIAWRTKERQ